MSKFEMTREVAIAILSDPRSTKKNLEDARLVLLSGFKIEDPKTMSWGAIMQMVAGDVTLSQIIEEFPRIELVNGDTIDIVECCHTDRCFDDDDIYDLIFSISGNGLYKVEVFYSSEKNRFYSGDQQMVKAVVLKQVVINKYEEEK